jgi:hypothetical protein
MFTAIDTLLKDAVRRFGRVHTAVYGGASL